MIYVFDINEEVIGFIPSSDLIEAMSTEELNGTHSVDFTAPNKVKDNNYFELIEKASYVGHKDVMQSSIFHMYSIIDIELGSSSFSVEGVHVAFEELSKYDIIRDRRPSQATAHMMLTSALQDTRWQVGEVDSTSSRDTTFYYIDPLEAVGKIKEIFGMEVAYRLDFDGSSIVGRYVDLVFERGGETGIRLYHGSNALSVTREEDRTELYTAYIGRGKGEEQFEDEGGESTDNYTRRITFTDVEWAVSSGDPVDKPIGQDYVEIPELTAEYGFSDGKPRIGVVVFEEIEVGDEEILLEETYKQLLEDSRPKVQYKSTVDRIGQVSIGDSVDIIRKDIKVYFTTRIFKVVRDLLDEKRTEVELGDKVDHGQERRRRQIDRKFEDIEQTTSSLVTTLQNRLRENLFNRTAYTYDLRPGNEWGLPAGLWSFDAPIDEDPERVIYIGAGQFAIANSKLPDGTWDFATFGDGDGFTADLITAGTMVFDRLQGGTATLGGAGNGFGRLIVLDDEDETIADLDAERGGFSDLQVDHHVVTGSFEAPDVVMSQSTDIEYLIRGTAGDDDNSGVGDWENALFSAREAINRLPKFIDGDVTLSFSNLYDISENLILDGFTGGGTITIDLRGNTFRGYIKTASCSLRIIIRDGEIERQSGTVYLIDNEGSSYLNITEMVLNGDGHDYGVRTFRSGQTYITNTEVYNVDDCFYATTLGRIFVASSAGLGNVNGVRVINGAIAHAGSTAPAGVENNTSEGNSALIIGSWTHDSGSATPPAPPVTEVTETWTANSSGAWRPNFGGQWNAGSRSPSPYQGTWDGFGAYKGLWFFGNGMRDTLNGKTIKRIRVKTSRLGAGGVSSGVGVVFRMHDYASRPSGEPTLSNTSHSVSFSWGQTRTFTLPSSFHSLFSNGNWRGLGIFSGSSPYAIMSTSCEIEVTYETEG